MIDSIQELLSEHKDPKEPGGSTFSTFDLEAKIHSKRRGCRPLLSHRLKKTDRHIRLLPLDKIGETGVASVEKPSKAFLTLRFHLDREKLLDQEIKRLAKHVPLAVRAARIGTVCHRVDWLGLKPAKHPRAETVFVNLLQTVRRKRGNTHTNQNAHPTSKHWGERGLKRRMTEVNSQPTGSSSPANAVPNAQPFQYSSTPSTRMTTPDVDIANDSG